MKKTFKILILFLAISITCQNCSNECDDCLELTTKSIKYINANATNLLFGSQAIYNPDSLVILAGNNNPVPFWKQEDVGAIMFNLESGYTTYHIVLSGALIDTLQFQLAERKSTLCCGNTTYSTKTMLNGQEIENKDLVIITP